MDSKTLESITLTSLTSIAVSGALTKEGNTHLRKLISHLESKRLND